MCRMLCLAGNYLPEYSSIMRSFWEITEKDPIITNKDGTFTSHDDGWGYVFHDGKDLEYFRSYEPIFKSSIPELPEGKIIMHARKAAPGEPKGIFACHPHFESDENYEVYLAHNGWFDKAALSKELDLKESEKYVDSHVFLKYIMSFSGDIEKRLRSALNKSRESGFIKTTANLMVLSLDRTTGKSKIYAYTDVAESREYTEFVRLYQIEGNGWKGIFSSSIIYSHSFPKNLRISEVPRDRIISL